LRDGNETCTKKKTSHRTSQTVAGTNPETCCCFVCEAGTRVHLRRTASELFYYLQ
jgi:hypothetical protein